MVDISYRKARHDIDPRADATIYVSNTSPAHVEGAATACPDGRVSTPLKETGPTTFNPGQKGRERRTTISIHGWTGYLCDQRIAFLFEHGQSQPRQHWRTLWVTDGRYSLLVNGGPLDVTRALTEEYIDRLDSVQKSLFAG